MNLIYSCIFFNEQYLLFVILILNLKLKLFSNSYILTVLFGVLTFILFLKPAILDLKFLIILILINITKFYTLIVIYLLLMTFLIFLIFNLMINYMLLMKDILLDHMIGGVVISSLLILTLKPLSFPLVSYYLIIVKLLKTFLITHYHIYIHT